MASAGSARSKCGRWVDVWSHPVVESLLRPADLGAFTLREFTRIRYLSQKKAPEKQTWNLFPGAKIYLFYLVIDLNKSTKLIT